MDLACRYVPALLDADPFLSREALAAVFGGAMPEPPDPANTRVERLLRPAVAEAVQEIRPSWRITPAAPCRRADLRLTAAPHYLIDNDAILYCRSAAPESWQGQPPLVWVYRVLAELLVTGRDRGGVIAVLLRDDSLALRLFEIPRDPVAMRTIVEAVQHWWRAFDVGGIAAPAPVPIGRGLRVIPGGRAGEGPSPPPQAA